MAESYGEWLRDARVAKGWTQQELADAAFMSRSMIAAIESGRRHPSEADAAALDAALGTGNVLVTFRPGQAARGGVADWFEKAREFEQQATVIRDFGLSFVPGLLQTEAYASAVIESSYPRAGEEQCHKRLVSRLARAELLSDPVTPEVWALLDESVIHRPIGGRAAMADQLDHIVKLAESGRVRVNLLPFGRSPHPLLEGMVTLMWFEDQPPVAYSEGMRVGKVHDSPAVVTEIQGAYNLALSEALALEPSLARLRSQAKEFRNHE